jgi:hypothetical protein
MTNGSGGQGGSPDAAGKPKVLYVLGAGRSGSTILGVALGNCEGVFFAGELDRWLPRSGVPRREGEELARLWRSVLAQAHVDPSLFAGPTPSLERSSALLDVRRWPRRRRLRGPYRQAMAALYQAIAASTGATHIVDSSHYPLRARELRAVEGIELHLLYLMRDPEAVVASLGRRDVPERRFGLLRANAYLWLTTLLSTIVFLGHPASRRIFLRYEDLVADPQRVLGAVLASIGADAAVPDLGALDTGLAFHGNRLLEQARVSLAGPPPRPPRRSLLTRIAQLPWSLISTRLQPRAQAREDARAPVS